EPLGQAREIAHAIVVAVGECLDVELIDDRILEPELVTGLLRTDLDVGGDVHDGLSRTAEHERGIILRVDAQPDAAPFEDVAFTGQEIFYRRDGATLVRRPDLDPAEVEPELARADVAQCHRRRHRIRAVNAVLDVANDLVVIDLREPQIAGLQQRRIALPKLVETADIALDVARLVPISNLELVFLGIEVFLFAGDRLVLEQ